MLVIGSYLRILNPTNCMMLAGNSLEPVLREGHRWPAPVRVSLGIIARNEEEMIPTMLESIFRQDLFARFQEKGFHLEIIVAANGCTDSTAAVAGEFLEKQSETHPCRNAFFFRVFNLVEKGKIVTWNRYVHELSAPEARALFLMDADIVLRHPSTLWNLFAALENDPEASISTDEPIKHISFHGRRNWREKLSLAASRLSRAQSAQISGQLYCIRSQVARNIYIPRELAACDDGFIKWIVGTDFLTRRMRSERFVRPPDASHVFQAYTAIGTVISNQKRQVIGQTMVHLLIDQELPRLSRSERKNLARTLRNLEQNDPQWLHRSVQAHLRAIPGFWKLYPGLISHRFHSLRGLPWHLRLMRLPVAIVGCLVTLAAARQAHQFLRSGRYAYWPENKSRELNEFRPLAPSPS